MAGYCVIFNLMAPWPAAGHHSKFSVSVGLAVHIEKPSNAAAADQSVKVSAGAWILAHSYCVRPGSCEHHSNRLAILDKQVYFLILTGQHHMSMVKDRCLLGVCYRPIKMYEKKRLAYMIST